MAGLGLPEAARRGVAVTGLCAAGFPEREVRARAGAGVRAVFPPHHSYGRAMFGAVSAVPTDDPLDAVRLVPPVFVPQRLEKLVDLSREPMFGDVELGCLVGGLRAALPVFVAAFGSTRVASTDLGVAVSRQAGQLGIPMVIGENVVPVNGYGRTGPATARGLLGRIRAYVDSAPERLGGVAIQQSTEDADAEVWNLVYSDPAVQPLLESGRLAFELKVGQGAKPGLGGMTVVDRDTAARIGDRYAIDDLLGDSDAVLRCSSPGTFTDEILRQQIRLMRNNYPRARVWVKLPPGRDVAAAVLVAEAAGADAVTVDGAEGGTGWAPLPFLGSVGLPLAECLRRLDGQAARLLVTGRMWEGVRALKCLALGARAVGLGRAALLAADENPESGLVRLVECMALELRLLISALGKYSVGAVDRDDIWWPSAGTPQVQHAQ